MTRIIGGATGALFSGCMTLIAWDMIAATGTNGYAALATVMAMSLFLVVFVLCTIGFAAVAADEVWQTVWPWVSRERRRPSA